MYTNGTLIRNREILIPLVAISASSWFLGLWSAGFFRRLSGGARCSSSAGRVVGGAPDVSRENEQGRG